MADSLRYGYIRVSHGEPDSRNLNTQRSALLVYGIRDQLIYSDEASGSTMDRPYWNALMEVVQPGDVIVIQFLDRLSRNVLSGLILIEELAKRDIHIIALADNIDTSDDTPIGKLMRHMMLTIAQWYWDTTRQRSMEGQQAARLKGKHIGRPPVPPAVRELVVQKYKEKPNQSEVSRATGVSRGSVQNILKEAGLV